jgi:catecholate siderophore receptor
MSRFVHPRLIGLLFLVSASVTVVLSPSSARAESRGPATFRFEIPPGELRDALAAFESVSGIDVVSPPEAILDGLQSPGVSATCTVDRALGQLLAGTGLAFRPSGVNSYRLEIMPLTESVEVRGRLPYQAETTSTATKTMTPLREVPQAVTVITQPMMADQLMTGIADIVRYVPGVGMAQGEGNRDTPIFRGNSTTSDFFVDGIRDDVQYFRDLYNVERVEALKGPNAMIFGRGGAGGVINRTTRQADWGTARELSVEGGSHEHRRATVDIDHPLNSTVAARLTGMYENSGSYRDGVDLERYGVNPTVAFMLPGSTTLRFGYERFHDERTADRGVPSFAGRPFDADPSVFFGDPQVSSARVTVNALTAGLDRTLGPDVLLRNRTRFADYDKFYQNVYPSAAVTPDGTLATLGGYNNATARRNVFNQTDLTFTAASGRVRHVMLAGAELGRQATDNFRNTGYFSALGPAATSMRVDVASPMLSVPVAFRQSTTDADNHGIATVIAVYAQDQVQLSRTVQAVAGLRYDRFEVDFHNNRTGADLSTRDDLVSPRAGFIYSPAKDLSLYTSYSLTYVPRAGDQLSSLSLTNEALDPEKFTNYEAGIKWDARPDLSLTAAVYRLNRTNVVVPDPTDATRALLVDGQRTQGVELGLAGNLTRSWRVLGAYAYQDGTITRTLSANARAGARLAQVPDHSFSLWNRYDVTSSWGVGLGVVHNGDRFTSTDNTVVLPAYTRVDGALYLTLSRQLRAQVNLENLFDERYWPSSNGNNNITPGAPRSVRVALTTRF